jgi:hypothetical protein
MPHSSSRPSATTLAENTNHRAQETVAPTPHTDNEVLPVAKNKPPKPRNNTPKAKRVGNRWAAPAMMTSAIIGLVWIVVFYVTNGSEHDIPVFSDLGSWNLVIGMGFIVAAFGFAMKWE